jgi:hypothetical protein
LYEIVYFCTATNYGPWALFLVTGPEPFDTTYFMTSKNAFLEGSLAKHVRLHRGREFSRPDNIWDTNLLKMSLLYRWESWHNFRLVRLFQRFFHRLDKTQVWTEYYILINSIIYKRTWSGKSPSLSLLLSCISIILFFCLFIFKYSLIFFIFNT